jgi:nucleoid DNA-binding protein
VRIIILTTLTRQEEEEDREMKTGENNLKIRMQQNANFTEGKDLRAN